MDDVGDLNGGKAWRTVKRPSDMVRLPRVSLPFKLIHFPE